MFRPEEVLKNGVHRPDKWKTNDSVVQFIDLPSGNIPLILGNHYYYRSRDDVNLKASQWRILEHIRNFNLTDDLLWNRLPDVHVQRKWGQELARRMLRLATFKGKCGNGVETLRSEGPDGGS